MRKQTFAAICLFSLVTYMCLMYCYPGPPKFPHKRISLDWEVHQFNRGGRSMEVVWLMNSNGSDWMVTLSGCVEKYSHGDTNTLIGDNTTTLIAASNLYFGPAYGVAICRDKLLPEVK